MKKFYSLISLLLVVSILTCLTSCDLFDKIASSYKNGKAFVPKTAFELWEKIDTTMNTLDSYENDTKVEMISFNQGKELRLTSTSEISVIDSKNSYAILSESDSVVEIPSANTKENMKMLEAFCDGKMYVANKTSSFEQKFVSKISAEKYQKLDEDILSTTDIDFAACTNSEFTKNEDGTWKILFSGYTKKTVDAFLELMKFKEEEFGADVDDMKITVICTEKFFAKSMIFELVFDQDATVKPTLKFTASFSNYNKAKIDLSKIKEEDYKSVPDAYILDIIENNFDEYISAEKGAFKLELENNVIILEDEENSEQSYDIEYGLENGSFYYNASVETNDENYAIKYKGGTETITYGAEKEEYSLTSEEAKEYITSLMNGGNYNKFAVSSIKKQDDDIYTLTISPGSEGSFDDYIDPSSGVTINSAYQEMTVVFSGEKLKKVSTSITMGGTFKSGAQEVAVTIITSYNVVFDDILTNETNTI